MATLEKYRDTSAHQHNGKQAAIPATSGYSRTEPRILTEDFAHQLAIANRERRLQRCPWLQANLAHLAEVGATGTRGRSHGGN